MGIAQDGQTVYPDAVPNGVPRTILAVIDDRFAENRRQIIEACADSAARLTTEGLGEIMDIASAAHRLLSRDRRSRNDHRRIIVCQSRREHDGRGRSRSVAASRILGDLRFLVIDEIRRLLVEEKPAAQRSPRRDFIAREKAR